MKLNAIEGKLLPPKVFELELLMSLIHIQIVCRKKLNSK